MNIIKLLLIITNLFIIIIIFILTKSSGIQATDKDFLILGVSMITLLLLIIFAFRNTKKELKNDSSKY